MAPPGTGARPSQAELLRSGRQQAQVDPAAPAVATAAHTAVTADISAAAGRTVRAEASTNSAARRARIVVAVAALLAAGVAAWAISGLSPLPWGLVAEPAESASPTPPGGASPEPSPIPAGATLIAADSLAAAGRWDFRDDPANETTCDFDGGLVVTSNQFSYRCPGPKDEVIDLAVMVEVTLLEPGSCAAVWFRFTLPAGGYVLRICQDGYYLATHGVPEPRDVKPLRYWPLDVPTGTPTRVGLAAEGTALRFYADGELVGTRTDTRFTDGYVGLGLLQMRTEDKPPYQVRFADVEIWGSDS